LAAAVEIVRLFANHPPEHAQVLWRKGSENQENTKTSDIMAMSSKKSFQVLSSNFQ